MCVSAKEPTITKECLKNYSLLVILKSRCFNFIIFNFNSLSNAHIGYSYVCIIKLL